MEKTWNEADMAIAATRMFEYLVQYMVAAGTLTHPALQNMMQQMVDNARKQGDGAKGVVDYTTAFANGLPGVTIR